MLRNNKNAMFIGLLALLALSEIGFVDSLASIVHQYDETWKSILSATGYGSMAVVIINRLLAILK